MSEALLATSVLTILPKMMIWPGARVLLLTRDNAHAFQVARRLFEFLERPVPRPVSLTLHFDRQALVQVSRYDNHHWFGIDWDVIFMDELLVTHTDFIDAEARARLRLRNGKTPTQELIITPLPK